MQDERVRLEIIDTKKRYKNFGQPESGFNNFWEIFFILLTVVILIILFTCYRCIYAQISYIFKRCFARRNQNNSNNNFSVTKEIKNDPCMRDPLLWPNTHNFSKFHMKYNDQRNRQYKLKTFLQEKKKLLCPHENKIVTSNHVDLTKQLLLRLSFSSSSLAHARTKGAPKPISNKWENINLENYKSNQLTIRSTKNRHPDSFKSNKDICFSDEDLKLLLISLSSEKSNTTKDGSLLHEWHAENVHYSRGQNNACSKLIELIYEDTNIFSNNTQKNRVSTSQSNCSPYSLLSNLAIDSKYFSDSMIKKPDIVPHMSINKLKRSTIINTLIKNTNSNIFTMEPAPEELVCNNENTSTPLNHMSEMNTIYDELGILFSQYIKLQTQPCQRKYCPLKRHLKQQARHSTKKCQKRFNYCQMYPYDQRPTCNSGNICADTYDELKLMCATSEKKRSIYRCMLKRRKYFLNQPCVKFNQNFIAPT